MIAHTVSDTDTQSVDKGEKLPSLFLPRHKENAA